MESGIDYEFRTTVVPSIHDGERIEKIAEYIEGARKYALQGFKPQDTIDPEFMSIKPYNPDEMKSIKNRVSKHVKQSVLRGV